MAALEFIHTSCSIVCVKSQILSLNIISEMECVLCSYIIRLFQKTSEALYLLIISPPISVSESADFGKRDELRDFSTRLKHCVCLAAASSPPSANTAVARGSWTLLSSEYRRRLVYQNGSVSTIPAAQKRPGPAATPPTLLHPKCSLIALHSMCEKPSLW